MISSRSRQTLLHVPAAGVLITAVTTYKRCCLDDPRSAHCVTSEISYCEARGWVHSLAWVVMPDHVHWLLQLKEGSLNACMAVFKARSERAIQHAVDRADRVWQAGYYERRLRGSDSLVTMARTIVANPLRRGLVERIDHYPYQFSVWKEPAAAVNPGRRAAAGRHPP